MRRQKSVYYAVHKGKKPGVYLHWNSCKAQVSEEPGAKFRKFTGGPGARRKAEEYVKTGVVVGGPGPHEPHHQNEEEYFPTDFWRRSHDGRTMSSEEALVVYTDGSNKGYGVFFGTGDRRNFSEEFSLPTATNNRCELMAVIRALEVIDEMGYASDDRERLICTDSKYVIGCMTEWYDTWKRTNWHGGRVKNRSLIERLARLCELHPVSFFWTPGHRGIEGNVEADKLAGEAGRGNPTPPRKASETPFAFQAM